MEYCFGRSSRKLEASSDIIPRTLELGIEISRSCGVVHMALQVLPMLNSSIWVL